MPHGYLIFRGRNCKPDNRTVFLMTPSCIVPTQDAVHLGHHILVANKDSLVVDATARFWRGYNNNYYYYTKLIKRSFHT